MTDFAYNPGDRVEVWDRIVDIRRIVDTEERRAYVDASGVYWDRAIVDAGELIEKANTGQCHA